MSVLLFEQIIGFANKVEMLDCGLLKSSWMEQMNHAAVSTTEVL